MSDGGHSGRHVLAPILPTRVRRAYRGGRLLDELEGRLPAGDSNRPEDWIASTTAARNPGLPLEVGEGRTRVLRPGVGVTTLAALIEEDPVFHLGEEHIGGFGTALGFLAKLLDSAMRLHVQVHPTSLFARERLGMPYGKLEVYYVLAIRPGTEGRLWLGFQHSPGREEWRRIVAGQDLAAMAACFDPIPVRPGEAWIVPGGMPHAIGEGVLMVEVMEPSDLVVRCEFEREGVVVPEAARFMGRGLDFCLDVFDYTSRTVGEIAALCRLNPGRVAEGPGWVLERLVGADRTSCFEIERLTASSHCGLIGDGRFSVVIQTRGRGLISSGSQSHAMCCGQACFVAASAASTVFSPGEPDCEWLVCRPAVRQ
ncbi:putative mannose-6-phosphate isomerase GmuF [mine drainage metagenome]|uniref:Putative mannose-6-phosphate isomerase GmuF n=1 Tax=mine drainage metagenome TaxID=410659 RepID=A0A1J5S5H2_9ZZZZ